MTSLRDLPPNLHLAVLRGEMTVEQAYNEFGAPSPENAERILDGKLPKGSDGFTPWPRRTQPANGPSAEARRLEFANELTSKFSELERLYAASAEQVSRLTERVAELEAIVVAFVDGGLR